MWMPVHDLRRPAERDMDAIQTELAALPHMPVKALRFRYQELFGRPANTTNRYFLLHKIAWRIQAVEFGDISEQARQRAFEIGSQCTLKGEILFASPHPQKAKQANRKREDKRLPPRTTVLTQLYRNREFTVTVLKDGFEYQGQRYRSLSAIARVITGTQWNGLVFFGLAKRGEKVDRTRRKPRLEKVRAA